MFNLQYISLVFFEPAAGKSELGSDHDAAAKDDYVTNILAKARPITKISN